MNIIIVFKVSWHHNQSRQCCFYIVNFEIIQHLLNVPLTLKKLIWYLAVLVTGKSIFAVDIHPDGSRFATGGQGMYTVLNWNIWVKVFKCGPSQIF